MRAPSTRTFVRRHGVTDDVTRCVQSQNQSQNQSQSPFLLPNGLLLTCSLLEQKPQTARESFANRLKRTGLETTSAASRSVARTVRPKTRLPRTKETQP